MRSIMYLALGLIGFPAMALTTVDLYQTQIVLDQSVEKPEVQARIDGMKEVIVRASGVQDSLINPVVEKALKQNTQYIAQLSYGQQDQQSTLKMRFNAPQINALLTQAQLPTWPAQRANVLIWLVEETSAERSIAWEHSDSSSLTELKQHAQVRGLPVTIPVGDFDDVTGVNVSDLWGGFALPVGKASQRYGVDAVLVVRKSGDNLRWVLYDQDPKTIGVTRQAPLSGSNSGELAVDKMIDRVSDYFAKQSSVYVTSESSESVTVRFTSLDDAVDFFVLERKLKQLNSVASLDIQKIQGNQVTFLVHLLATPTEFEQQVSRMREAKPIEVVQPAPIAVVPDTKLQEMSQDESLTMTDMAAQGESLPQPLSEVSAQQALPLITEQTPAQPVEVPPALMFEWHSEKYVAPAPEATEPNTDEAVESTFVETDIDA